MSLESCICLYPVLKFSQTQSVVEICVQQTPAFRPNQAHPFVHSHIVYRWVGATAAEFSSEKRTYGPELQMHRLSDSAAQVCQPPDQT